MGSYSVWQRAAELINSIRSTGAAASCQAHDESTRRSWDLAATLTAAPGGDGHHMILVIVETTHVVELQASLIAANNVAARIIVSGVAHEVRNPLFGITSTLDPLRRASVTRKGTGVTCPCCAVRSIASTN